MSEPQKASGEGVDSCENYPVSSLGFRGSGFVRTKVRVARKLARVQNSFRFNFYHS